MTESGREKEGKRARAREESARAQESGRAIRDRETHTQKKGAKEKE